MALRTAAGLAAVCLLCLVGYAAWAARASFPAPPGRPVVAGSRLSAFSVAAEEERGPGTPTAPASLQRDINMLPQNSSAAAALGPGFGGVRDADDTGAYRDPADTLAADIAACTRHGSAGISGFVHLRVRHGAAHVPGLSDGSVTGAPRSRRSECPLSGAPGPCPPRAAGQASVITRPRDRCSMPAANARRHYCRRRPAAAHACMLRPAVSHRLVTAAARHAEIVRTSA